MDAERGIAGKERVHPNNHPTSITELTAANPDRQVTDAVAGAQVIDRGVDNAMKRQLRGFRQLLDVAMGVNPIADFVRIERTGHASMTERGDQALLPQGDRMQSVDYLKQLLPGHRGSAP